jgi:hypothetical protein
MGVSELREAFNSVSEPTATCSLAMQSYERVDDQEWQVLLFRGTTSDGGKFEIKSSRLPARTDLNAAAREAAQQLLENDTP